MRKVIVVVILCVLGGCAPSWDESCSSYCEWVMHCAGPSSGLPSAGACEAAFCTDGQDRWSYCWHEVWDWMDCVGASSCAGAAECEGLLGPCNPEIWQ
jgi:hypothetical protein